MTTVTDIQALLDDPHPAPRSLATLQGWFDDPDPEVQGAAFVLTTRRPDFPWSPPLDAATLDGFARAYFERRIKGDDGGDWAHSRYEAAWDLARWVALRWFDAEPPAKHAVLVEWLGRLYRTGGEAVRSALINGTFEHLFERKDIRAAFKSWKSDDELKVAYQAAEGWAAGGGVSSLVGPKPSHRKGK